MAPKLTDEEMAELAALADGTLPDERRQAVEARVAASPQLQSLLERQRRAVQAMHPLANEPVPAGLSDSVAARQRKPTPWRGRSARLVPRLAIGGAAGLAVAIALVVAIGGGASGPTVADAAQLAARPPTGPPPSRLDSSPTQLAARVDGVVFPDLRRLYGWRPVGVRHGSVDGRDATVVYYAKAGRRIAYAIVAGSGLPQPSGGRKTLQRGVEYQALRVNGRPTVTWRRLGHTCVLTGTASSAELLALASWRGGGTLRY